MKYPTSWGGHGRRDMLDVSTGRCTQLACAELLPSAGAHAKALSSSCLKM